MDSTYPLYPIACFLALLLVLLPLRPLLQSWQTSAGACAYALWVAVALLAQFVNAVVWRDNAVNWAPVWCDISARIIVGSSVAVPAASLTISRRLYKIAQIKTVSESEAEKRRGLIVDLLLCFGLPLAITALSYVVQGHRFNIYEEIGCYPAIYNVTLAYPLLWMWPLFVGLVAVVYCALITRAFVTRRAEFADFTASASLTRAQYIRLLALASADALVTVPLAALSICMNATEDGGVDPWRGWANAHWGFSRVSQVPSVLWRRNGRTVAAFAVTRAAVVVCAAMFFVFFGLARKQCAFYGRVVRRLLRWCEMRWRAVNTDSAFGSGKAFADSGDFVFRTPELAYGGSAHSHAHAHTRSGKHSATVPGIAVRLSMYAAGTGGWAPQPHPPPRRARKGSAASSVSVGSLSSEFTVESAASVWSPQKRDRDGWVGDLEKEADANADTGKDEDNIEATGSLRRRVSADAGAADRAADEDAVSPPPPVHLSPTRVRAPPDAPSSVYESYLDLA